MSERYLLPCECGQPVLIELSQAGQSLKCTCGRTLQAPPMRGIRQLAMAVEPVAAKSTKAAWNPVKGALFAIGTLLLVPALLGAAYNYYVYSRLSGYVPSEEEYQTDLQGISAMAPFDLLMIWNERIKIGLGDFETLPYYRARMQMRGRWKLTVVSAGIAAAGVAAIACSLLVPGSRRV